MTRFIDNFCRKHPRFGIPNLMKYLAIANVVLWILNMVNSRILVYLTFDPYMILHGQVWRLISFLFIPPSTGFLAIISFYFYYMLGNMIEANWGTAKFTLYVLFGWLISVLFGFILYFAAGINISLSAHYIYMSLFFAFAVLYPDMTVLLFFIIPLKMKWLAIVFAVLYVRDIIANPFPLNLLPILAVLNFLLFCGPDLLYSMGLKKNKWNPSSGTGSRSGPRVINFGEAKARIRKEQTANLYNHRCSVCGRTDQDHPELEYRFCSRCAGYHCFCQDHINNHVHFQE